MLKTEMRNPKTTHIDQMSTLQMLQVIQTQYKNSFSSF
jgi:N-acetylmuramic acid 6-phosphate (MurNAc-6-P) etherase